MRACGRHPARISGLHRLLDHLISLGPGRIWLARRADIAEHWKRQHPPPLPPPPPPPTLATDVPHAAASAAPSAPVGLPVGLPVSPPVPPVPPPRPHPPSKGPRLLVTGGGGFVLSHVVLSWFGHASIANCPPAASAGGAAIPAGSDGDLPRSPSISGDLSSCVIFDRHFDAAALAFLREPIASGRLHLFTGDVGDPGCWARLACDPPSSACKRSTRRALPLHAGG